MLRAIVDAGTRRFTRALEPLVRPGASLPGGATSLTELVLGAEHLEHFHEYDSTPATEAPTAAPMTAAHPAAAPPPAAAPRANATRASPALALHVDAGLFIAICLLYTSPSPRDS